MEFGDAYCHPEDRADFVDLYRALINHPRVKIVPADTRLFRRGVDLFERRMDKDWSLTDCLSFVVMKDEGIMQALTGDSTSNKPVSAHCSDAEADSILQEVFPDAPRA